MTATDSDRLPRVGVGGADRVQSAVHSPSGDTDPGSNARPRGRPRENSPDSALLQDDSAPESEADTNTPIVTVSEVFGGVREAFTPPDIWSQERPSLSQIWAYATHGEWTNKTGLPRRAGKLDAILIAVPLVALAYTIAWIAERPSRRIATVVLLVLLAQVPPLSWLI
jgi:hypothetical protein